MLTYLVSLFVTVLIIANVTANVMIQIGPWAVAAGVIVFPITYILSDVFSEVYGLKWSRKITWMASAGNALLALCIWLVIYLPHPGWFSINEFAAGVGSSWRIVVASITAFCLGDLLNDYVFHIMKRNPNGKFGTRAILSSLCGELVDTSVFTLIAFIGVLPASEMIPTICITVFLKTLYEILILPVTGKVVQYVQSKESKT